jgi:hypothetical protein
MKEDSKLKNDQMIGKIQEKLIEDMNKMMQSIKQLL